MKLSCYLLVPGMLLALTTAALAGPIATPTATPTGSPGTPTPTATPTGTVAPPTGTPTTIPTPTATPTATPTSVCELTVEVNALRGGSPTVAVGETKKITAKARIVRGTAVSGTTAHTTLQIEAIDGTEVIQTRTSCPYLLEVGKGGQGAAMEIPISQCVGGSIVFRATFFENENGDCSSKLVCPLATREITKTCK